MGVDYCVGEIVLPSPDDLSPELQGESMIGQRAILNILIVARRHGRVKCHS
jgi:hypothetical protein